MGIGYRFEQPCTACSKGTNYQCDKCHRPFCGHGACLWETGRWLSFPSDSRNEDYKEGQTWDREEELCLQCYIEVEGLAPLSLWADTSRHLTIAFNTFALKPGALTTAGDAHSWYQPPSSGNMIKLLRNGEEIEIDTFSVVQLYNFLQSHEAAIREHAKKTAELLIPLSHAATDAAIRADAGQRFEEDY